MPAGLQALHRVAAIAGVAVLCVAPIVSRASREARGARGRVLLALLGNAAITGGLSRRMTAIRRG